MEVFLDSKQGERYCGDRFLSVPSQLSVLYVMIDGVGHGKEASLAADKACISILSASDQSLTDIAVLCGKALNDTRGVAISLVRQHPNQKLVEYIAIGNIETLLVCDSRVVRLNRKPGIFGARKRRIEINSQAFSSNASLLMYTDGVGHIPPSLMHQFINMKPHHMVKVLSDRWTGKDDICILCDEFSHG